MAKPNEEVRADQRFHASTAAILEITEKFSNSGIDSEAQFVNHARPKSARAVPQENSESVPMKERRSP